MTYESAPSQHQELEYWIPYHYITKFRDSFSQHYVDTWGINYALTLEFIINRVSQLRPETVIDIGCGDGRLTRELSFCSSISILQGIDYSEKAIALASAMNTDRTNINFKALDITEKHSIELSDLAVLIEVFEHIPLEHCHAFVRGVRSLLNTGAKLLITVPHSNKSLEYKHYQHFTFDSLLPYFDGLFAVDKIIPFEKMSITRKLLSHLLCNKLFVLNNKHLLNLIYSYHRKFLFFCDTERECQRIYLELTAI